MKKVMLLTTVFSALLLYGSIFALEEEQGMPNNNLQSSFKDKNMSNPEMTDKNPNFFDRIIMKFRGNPEQMNNKRRMTENQGEFDFSMILVRYLDLETTIEKYNIQTQKAFLNGKEKGLELNQQRRDLIMKIAQLSEEYKTNKTIASDLTKTINESFEVQKKLLAINKSVMNDIEEINEARDAEINKAIENWIKKSQSDPEELDKFMTYIDNIKKRMPKRMDINKRVNNEPALKK